MGVDALLQLPLPHSRQIAFAQHITVHALENVPGIHTASRISDDPACPSDYCLGSPDCRASKGIILGSRQTHACQLLKQCLHNHEGALLLAPRSKAHPTSSSTEVH